MTATELLRFEVDQVGFQINACVEGMSEAGFDTPCGPGAMSPRDILEHLAEAYTALIASCKGEKHAWGSFVIPDKSSANLVKVFTLIRNEAVETALAHEDEATLKHVYDYIIGHDNYHVGQLVLSRLQAEPDWNSNAIYGF